MGIIKSLFGDGKTSKEVIWTNRATRKRRQYGLSKEAVIDAFNYPTRTEPFKGDMKKAIKSYKHYEVGVIYRKNKNGHYIIISCWRYKKHF